MLIRQIDGATRVVGREQGYFGLPVRDELTNCSVNGPDTPAMVTAWEPTPDELLHLQAGASIYVRILGSRPPPMMVYVGPSPAEPFPSRAMVEAKVKQVLLRSCTSSDMGGVLRSIMEAFDGR